MSAGLRVIEGIDGAGKSSVSPVVAERLDWRFVPKRGGFETSDFVATTMQGLAAVLWSGGKDNREFSSEFWLNLQVAWFTAMSETVLKGRLQAGPTVVDGWYYKFVAKLVVAGYSAPELLKRFSGVTVPDRVVLLSVDPRDTWARRQDYRPGELGLYLDYVELGEASYVDYQTRIQQVLLRFAEELRWTVVEVDRGDSLDQTAGRVALVLDDLGAPIEHCAQR